MSRVEVGKILLEMDGDHVDEIISQWREQRPDVDVSAMAVIGRISRLERLIRPRLNSVFSQHGLESWEFDVLATLRRSGPPFRLSAGQLLESMMITSGTMTHRIDRLSEREFIRRVNDPTDRRVVLVELTEKGLVKIDQALPDHASNETRLLDSLTARERDRLIELLRKLHSSLDQDRLQGAPMAKPTRHMPGTASS